MPRRRRPLPAIQAPKTSTLTLGPFAGMNNTDHPTAIKDEILTNAQNTFIKNAMLEKRGGVDQIGSSLSSQHQELFTATTKKDTPTTADWTTDGAANLTINTTASVDTTNKSQRQTGNDTVVVSTNGTIVIFYAEDSTEGLKAKKSADNGSTWIKLDGSAGETQIDSSSCSNVSAFIDSSDHIHIAYTTGASEGPAKYRKLTYSAGSWTVGSAKSVSASNVSYVAIVVDGSTIWVATNIYKGSPFKYEISLAKSTDGGDSWENNLIKDITTGYDGVGLSITMNDSKPFIICAAHSWYWDDATDEVTEHATGGYGNAFFFSYLKVAENNILHYNSGTIRQFNGSSWSTYKVVDPTTYANQGSMTTDGTNIWVVYGKYEALNQYEISFMVYDGSTWGESIDITSDNANYIKPTLPKLVYNWVPIVWFTGSATFTIKARVAQISGILQSVGYDSGAGSQTYAGTVTKSLSTGSAITEQYADSADNTTFGSFTSTISGLNKQYIKFKLTLTTTNLATPPTVSSVAITYSGAPVVGLHSFTTSAGVGYLLAVSGTNLYVYESDTTWRSIKSDLTTGLMTTAAPFQNFLIITNGTDAPVRFNGKTTTGTVSVTQNDATVTGSAACKWATASHENQLSVGGKIKLPDNNWYTITTVTSDTSIEISVVYPGANASTQTYQAYGAPALAGTPPSGKYVVTHQNHVFMSGISAYPTRVQHSGQGDATDWTGTTSGLQNVSTNDGQIITGMASLRDVLLIGKYDAEGTKKSIQGLYGRVSADFNIKPLTTEYGFVGQYSVAVTPNTAVFVDRVGIVETNGFTFNRIDTPINATFIAANQTYLSKATAIYHDEQVFISIPYSTSTYNNYLLDYDTRERGWTIHTGITAGQMCLYNNDVAPEIFFGDASTVGAIIKFDTGTDDNGQPITWTVETKEFDFKKYFVNKRFKYLYAFFEPTGSFNVDAYYSLDGAAYVQLTGQADLSGSDDAIKRWVMPGLTGSTIKFKLTESSSTSSVKLVKLAIVGIEKRLRRQ